MGGCGGVRWGVELLEDGVCACVLCVRGCRGVWECVCVSVYIYRLTSAKGNREREKKPGARKETTSAKCKAQ